MKNEEKNISPKKLWIVYGACLGLSIVIGLLPIEQETIASLGAIINLPTMITVLVALLCAPVRLIQAIMKKDKKYLTAGVLCGLLPLTHIGLATIFVLGQ
jgi:hypothetical protein